MVCVLVIMYDYVDLARIKLSSCRDNSHLSICVVISCGFELIHLSGNPWRFSSGDPTHLVNASCYIYIYIYNIGGEHFDNSIFQLVTFSEATYLRRVVCLISDRG
jgi:hypothetical protein